MRGLIALMAASLVGCGQPEPPCYRLHADLERLEADYYDQAHVDEHQREWMAKSMEQMRDSIAARCKETQL